MAENKPIKCVIIDDEPPARKIIRDYISEIPSLTCEAECANAVDALPVLRSANPDLIFLDIKMPRLSGIDFLKSLNTKIPVILTTAHMEFALEGYDLNVVDYLLKPIKFERFFQGVQKAFAHVGDTENHYAGANNVRREHFIYVRADRKMVKVILDNILFIESMKDYVKIIFKDETVITKQSLGHIEQLLSPADFLRVHRSFIVSLSKIDSFTSEYLEIGKHQIPIGSNFRSAVISRLEAGG